MQWITSVQTRTKQFTVLTVRLIKSEKTKWFLCLYLLECVFQSTSCSPRLPNMQWENQVAWKCTWDHSLLPNCSFWQWSFRALVYFCSGQAGGKVSEWWAWMDALLTDPQVGHLGCKDHTKHLKFCCKIFCLKVQGKVLKSYSLLLWSVFAKDLSTGIVQSFCKWLVLSNNYNKM